jgi:hypothetical protein
MRDARPAVPHKLSTYETAGSGADLRDGRWHHLAAVFDRQAQQQRFYVDGHRVHSRALDDVPKDHSFDNDQSLKIGMNDGTDFARGYIDEVAVFDRALTDAQIQQLRTVTAP